MKRPKHFLIIFFVSLVLCLSLKLKQLMAISHKITWLFGRNAGTGSAWISLGNRPDFINSSLSIKLDYYNRIIKRQDLTKKSGSLLTLIWANLVGGRETHTFGSKAWSIKSRSQNRLSWQKFILPLKCIIQIGTVQLWRTILIKMNWNGVNMCCKYHLLEI